MKKKFFFKKDKELEFLFQSSPNDIDAWVTAINSIGRGQGQEQGIINQLQTFFF